jgi:hypothetical protein
MWERPVNLTRLKIAGSAEAGPMFWGFEPSGLPGVAHRVGFAFSFKLSDGSFR